MQNNGKKTVAVLFGSRSPEHDVSIVTALQTIKALDPNLYQALPVYISTSGEWLLGEELLTLSNYMLTDSIKAKLTKVCLDLGNNYNNLGESIGKLVKVDSKISNIFKKNFITFDIALLALHGIHGEDGQLAALMELANIPYTGMRNLGATIAMNKFATKRIAATLGIPVLPDVVISRPNKGLIVAEDILIQAMSKIGFPVCLKPCNLGSSIGVGRANNLAELIELLPNIFKYDHTAILEPFVENLIEYNISVGKINHQLVTSAIEIPKCHGDLLDFKQKYLSSGNQGNKFGTKSAEISSGMLSMTRELNPTLDPKLEQNIRNWAELAFTSLQGSGFPRLDFISNSKTGEIWLNEINPCPGSFGFYLWEASQHKLLFTELLNSLLAQAQEIHANNQLPADPTPIEARLFPRI